MSDVIQKTAKYRIKQIELAEAKYYKSLITVLDRIETQVTALASRDLPIQDGKLIELQSAIAIRPKIKQILDTEYLPLADQIVRDGFNEQAKRIEKAFKRIGNIPVEFQELTKGDLQLIQNLKQQWFTQFKDVSNTFTRRLSEKIYQNTLVGNDFTQLAKFARDRAGDNMKKYAGQILNDGLREFDAQLNIAKATEAGLTYLKYQGSNIPTTREFCRR
jgi:hypothetical protein